MSLLSVTVSYDWSFAGWWCVRELDCRPIRAKRGEDLHDAAKAGQQFTIKIVHGTFAFQVKPSSELSLELFL